MDRPVPTVKDVFDHAHEITSAGERSSYLDRACAGDSELRAKVEALLLAFDAAGSFLERPAVNPEETGPYLPGLDTPAPSPLTDVLTVLPDAGAEHGSHAEGPGSWVGPYRLVQELGEGGMGAVYLAEQDRPIRRQVALKIIKPSMDSAAIVARFEAERQALTMMEHPNIAQVYDAGTTQNGRPYFVMELVKGIPMARFCNENTLTVRERLELFETVCQAIQHAHTKGVLHRDIKPSNVLVALIDGRPTAKVIDFGLAKAIDQPLTEHSQMTQAGAVVGTLEYMSPEQADPGGKGVDTRTDIYSLGVMLYESLTSTTPLDRSTLRGLGFIDVVFRIVEEEAPKPSVRVAGLGDQLPAVAAERRTDPVRLVKLLRGELDWIALKALEKDRNRRYDTASAFAKDVRRYLDDEAEEACPPSVRYRLGKFVRKHRGLVAAASGFVVLLALGVVGLTLGIIAVNGARQREENQRKAADAERTRAQDAERRAHDTNRLAWAGIRALTYDYDTLSERKKAALRDIQKRYSEIQRNPGGSAELQASAAEAEHNLAVLAAALGTRAEAEQRYRQAIALYERVAEEFGDKAEYRNELGRCYFDLAHLLRTQGKGSDAAAAFGRALALYKNVTDEFPDDPAYRRELADAYNDLGVLRLEVKDIAQAEAAFREAVRLGEKVAAEQPSHLPYRIKLAAGYGNLANVVRDRGNVQGALAWYGKVIDLLTPLQPRPDNATTFLCNAHWDRANALGQLGKHADAVRDWKRALTLDPGPRKGYLRCFLEAEQMEAEITAQSNPTGELLHKAAAASARAVVAAAEAEETGLKERYAQRALALLEQARSAGWFRDPSRGKELKADKTFRSLPAGDFKRFVASLGSDAQ